MFPHFRRLIETQFNTKVYDTYGSTEGFVIAGQCSEGNYHVFTPQVFVELLDEHGREVAAGEMGYVVATRLDAFAMPLIRYYLGDIAVKGDPAERCRCGRALPLLKQIIGRDTDVVITPLGKRLIVHFFTGIFEHVAEIRQFRVVQKSTDHFIIEYVPDETKFTPAILEDVTRTMRQRANEPIDVRYREVAEIPSSPSGKPQIVQSFLENEIPAGGH
jgi:phenylacetate-CoA ligase